MLRRQNIRLAGLDAPLDARPPATRAPHWLDRPEGHALCRGPRTWDPPLRNASVCSTGSRGGTDRAVEARARSLIGSCALPVVDGELRKQVTPWAVPIYGGLMVDINLTQRDPRGRRELPPNGSVGQVGVVL